MRGSFQFLVITLLAARQALPAPNVSAAERSRIVVAFSSGVPAYSEAVQGIRQTLGGLNAEIVEAGITGKNSQKDLENELSQNPRLVVAVGTDAVAAVLARHTGAPVVSTMTMAADEDSGKGGGHRVAAVHLDVPLESLLAEFQKVFPGKKRIGILRSASRAAVGAGALKTLCAGAGFTARVVDCDGPADLIRSFLSLKGAADFVICLPDGALFNSATVKPLILASLENRLPIVGFSASFVRAGAVVGIYPDFAAVGRQTAELIKKILAGQPVPGAEGPQQLAVSVNQRVVRLMGLDFREPHDREVVMFK